MDSTFSDSLKEALKGLLTTLRVPTIFPALLLVFTNLYWGWPQFCKLLGWNTAIESPWAWGVVAGITLMISYWFYANGQWISSLFSGEFLSEGWFRSQLINRQKIILKYGAGLGRVTDERLALFFVFGESFLDKKERSRISPTLFGNVLSMTNYIIAERYGIDRRYFRDHMLAVRILNQNYGDTIKAEEEALEFLLNVTFISCLLGFEWLCAALYSGVALPWIVYTFLFWISACFCYSSAIFVAARWSEKELAFYDLYRWKLHEYFGLFSVNGLKNERKLWKWMGQFLIGNSGKVNWEFQKYFKRMDVFEYSQLNYKFNSTSGGKTPSPETSGATGGNGGPTP